MSSIYKAAGVISIVLMAIFGARIFTPRELIVSLVAFCVIEALLVLTALKLGLDLNVNSLSHRMTGAAMILFVFSRLRILRWGAIALALAVSLSLQCRTSAVGVLGALTILMMEQRTRNQRTFWVFLALGGVFILILLSGEIYALIQEMAISNLGSDHPLAQFFLSDKSTAKIESDPLDRKAVWEASWHYISERPWLGYGIGSENEILGARSHNAFLSLIFEGGILYLIAWVSIYLLFARQVLNTRFVRTFSSSRLYRCAMLLFAYLMLAGMVESSGIGSVSTPGNVVFILLFSYLLSVRHRFSPRQPFSSYEQLSLDGAATFSA